jgi:outer membrane protein TolC
MEGMRGVPFSGAVPIPIFDDGSVPRARAEATWQLAMIERFELAQSIEAEVRATWTDRVAARETLEAREAEQRDLERALASTRAAYDAGLAPLEEVLRLETRRLDVLDDAIDARAALDLSRIALRRAVGGVPDPASIGGTAPAVTRRRDRATEDRS